MSDHAAEGILRESVVESAVLPADAMVIGLGESKLIAPDDRDG